jgi:hypothetical protein
MTTFRRVVVELLLALLAASVIEALWPRGPAGPCEERGHSVYVLIGTT